MSSYNLNLSPSYAPNWSAYHVAREIICNAMDADREGMTIQFESDDALTVRTQTVPDLAELFVIGHGTKEIGGSTIGQFGEGFKLAALVATRAEGGSIRVALPTANVLFGMSEAIPGCETLHAFVAETAESQADGYAVRVEMPGIREACDGRFLWGAEYGPVIESGDKARIYVKGVFIAELPTTSVWSWNFETLPLNRDRDRVSDYDVRRTIGQWLERNVTLAQAQRILASNGLEAESLWGMDDESEGAKTFVKAFYDLYGPAAVIADDLENDRDARRRGLVPVVVSNYYMKNALEAFGVHTTATATSGPVPYEEVPTPDDFAPMIAQLREIAARVEPDQKEHAVRVFTNETDLPSGYADDDGPTIWLAVELFEAGRLEARVAHYLRQLSRMAAKYGKYASEASETRLADMAMRGAMIAASAKAGQS